MEMAAVFFFSGLDCNSKTVSGMHMHLLSNCRYILYLRDIFALLLLGTTSEVYFWSKLTTEFQGFHKYPKIEVYGDIYLRSVNRCKCETLSILPSKGELSGVLVLKLHLQAVLG
jgi:hypothetical protein